MPQRIQILRGTTGEWTTDDVVLLLGELGTDTTTGIVKIGDGTSTWSALDGITLLPATTTAVGGVELATSAETITGTDTERAVTPAGGAAAYQPLAAVLTGTTASYTTAEASKLAGIEAGADVTDTTNVTAAGALMDSEVDADIKTLSLPANTTISAFGATLVDDADAGTARTTLGVAIGSQVQAYSAVLAGTTASFTTADETKLDGIATGATVYTDEMARDAIGTALVAGSNITITPNDGADTITIAASGGGGGDLVKIATITVSGGATTEVAFTSIAADYSHLRIIGVRAGPGSNVNTYLRLNTDAGTNYDYVNLAVGSGSGPTRTTASAANQFLVDGYSTNGHTSFDILIPFYTKTVAANRSVRWNVFGTGFNGQVMTANGGGRWLSTAAITGVSLTTSASFFADGDAFILYGIE